MVPGPGGRPPGQPQLCRAPSHRRARRSLLNNGVNKDDNHQDHRRTPGPRHPGAWRLRRVLATLAVLLVSLAGYATWINTQSYTLQASVQIRRPRRDLRRSAHLQHPPDPPGPGAVHPAGGLHRRGGPVLRRSSARRHRAHVPRHERRPRRAGHPVTPGTSSELVDRSPLRLSGKAVSPAAGARVILQGPQCHGMPRDIVLRSAAR